MRLGFFFLGDADRFLHLIDELSHHSRRSIQISDCTGNRQRQNGNGSKAQAPFFQFFLEG